MTFTKAGHKKGTFSQKDSCRISFTITRRGVFFVLVEELFMPTRQTMDHRHVEMIIPIIIKMEVKKLISGACTLVSVTSFAAFRLSNVNGFEIPAAYGNANEWGHRARREGYRVDSVPTIGSIAWSTAGGYGHVAWVSKW